MEPIAARLSASFDSKKAATPKQGRKGAPAPFHASPAPSSLARYQGPPKDVADVPLSGKETRRSGPVVELQPRLP